MNKRQVQLLLEVLTVVLAGLIGTGLLLEFRLPPGSGGRRFLLGLARHEWATVHLYLAATFVTLVAVHLYLHRKWIEATVAGTDPRQASTRKRRFVNFCIALTLLILFPCLTPVVERGHRTVECVTSGQPGQGAATPSGR